ncbi:MAG: hypothetical protein CSA45_01775 [Gammaproteobacteria bacterium]|nr:MAG: hypothetical protein CSA45_01775 [Gammaproteobacteria bacterium]
MRLIRLLKNDLAKETTGWVEKHIISPEQAVQICAQYGIDYHNQNKRSYGYFILTILGFLFVGLALITIIGANWEDIPRPIRMIGLISLTLLVNLIGIHKVSQAENTAAIAIFFLGGLFYGASIMLIAQIYHIGEHYPDGVFWWAIGVFPLALLMRSSLLMLLATVLGYIWFFTESSLHFYPTLFPVFLIALAWHCFSVKQSSVLFLMLISGACFWLEYSLSWLLGDFQHFNAGIENIFAAIFIFIFLYGFATRLVGATNTTLKDYGTLLGVWVLRFTLLSLFIFSFREPWNGILSAEWQSPIVTLALAAFLAISAIWMTHRSKKALSIIVAVSLLFVAILLLVIFYPDMISYSNTIPYRESMGYRLSTPLQLIDNIVLVLSGIGLIVQGVHHSITHYFFLGIITILLTAMLRYIDLIGNYIGAALLFAVFAAILLSAARFWKSHHLKQKAVTS